MKTKKTLAILLAVMMILSALPIASLAAEAPTVTEWPTIVETSLEVGMLRGDVTLVGGVAPVPGKFEVLSPTSAYTAPSASTKVTIRFKPDDTETYKNVSMPSAQRPVIEIKPCSQPTLQGEITAKKILIGAAIGTSELSLAEGAAAMAYTKDISNRVASITFDNPDKVYTEVGTYEEPVTIKFAIHTSTGLPYAVDLKATAKIKVSDKIDSEIITLPTLESNGIPESKKAGDLVFVGGEGSTAGKFVATNPDQELVVGENTVNLTFIPDDLTKYEPATADATFTLSGKFEIPENIVITVPYNRNLRVQTVKGTAEKFGINIVPSNASISCNTSANSTEVKKTLLVVGDEFKCKASVSLSGYAQEIVDVTIKVVPALYTASPARASLQSTKLQDDGSYIIEASYGAYYASPDFNGNVIIRVNGEKVGEAPINTRPESYTYHATKSGEYVVTAEYVPHEDDWWYFEDTSLLTTTSKSVSLDITMPREVTSTGRCKIGRIYPVTENGLALPGAEVTVRRDPIETHEKFDGWTFYDDAGNEFIPEGLAEDYMTQQEIRFIMPNHDVKVKATVSLNLGGGDEPGTDEPGTDEPGTDEPGIELPDIDLPDIELPDIDYDDMSQGDHNIPTVNFFKNLVKMIKDFIQQIGEFFASLRIEDLGGLITQ